MLSKAPRRWSPDPGFVACFPCSSQTRLLPYRRIMVILVGLANSKGESSIADREPLLRKSNSRAARGARIITRGTVAPLTA